MTDLHTHILPGMDDGAESADVSLAMLYMEQQQGVKVVGLTPHFYCDRETPGHFLQRRQKAVSMLEQKLCALPAEERHLLPKCVLGAEVAWWPDLAEWDELDKLCIQGTKNLLLELPFTPWNSRMINLIYDLIGKTGITPVIAHLERYLKNQRPAHIQEILQLGVPVQISGDIMLHSFQRAGALKLLRQRGARFLSSDCHDTKRRPPNLMSAMAIVQKKLGDVRVDELCYCADELVEKAVDFCERV